MKSLSLTVVTLLGTISPLVGMADEVRLEHGGRVHGEILRGGDTPRSQLAVLSPWGRMVLDRGQIAQVLSEEPAKIEYVRRAPTVSDTADSQFALAQWCRDNGLGNELRTHLARVLELDPEHEEARRLLGYQHINGQWVTRGELLASRGLIRHGGDYRTRQEVALVERKEQAEETARQWKKRLRGWRNDLAKGNNEVARAAAEAFANLKNPEASGALAELLSDEPNIRVKVLLIDAAGRVNTSVTLQALVRIALNEPNLEARAASLERLRDSGRLALAGPFVASLRSADNFRVNLAADGLAVLGDENTIRPLIDALVTTHRTRTGNDSGGDTYSLNTGTGQHSFGGSGPKVVKRDLKNPRVLNALVELTDVNFLYDESRWREWLASREIVVSVDLRRDP